MIVTPAKAGAQVLGPDGIAGLWIPAFAGMAE